MAALPTKIEQELAYKLLSSAGTFSTTLHYILLVTFREEVYEMLPAEIFNELEERYSVKLPQEVEDRINALLTLMLTNGYWNDPQVCRAVTLAFAEGNPGFEAFQEDPTIPEVIWAAYEASLNREPVPYGPRVRAWLDGLEQGHGWEVVGEDPEDEPEEVEVAAWLASQDDALTAQLTQLGVPPSARPPLAAFMEAGNAPFQETLAGVQ